MPRCFELCASQFIAFKAGFGRFVVGSGAEKCAALHVGVAESIESGIFVVVRIEQFELRG